VRVGWCVWAGACGLVRVLAGHRPDHDAACGCPRRPAAAIRRQSAVAVTVFPRRCTKPRLDTVTPRIPRTPGLKGTTGCRSCRVGAGPQGRIAPPRRIPGGSRRSSRTAWMCDESENRILGRPACDVRLEEAVDVRLCDEPEHRRDRPRRNGRLFARQYRCHLAPSSNLCSISPAPRGRASRSFANDCAPAGDCPLLVGHPLIVAFPREIGCVPESSRENTRKFAAATPSARRALARRRLMRTGVVRAGMPPIHSQPVTCVTPSFRCGRHLCRSRPGIARLLGAVIFATPFRRCSHGAPEEAFLAVTRRP
jgi:hypothetical protein